MPCLKLKPARKTRSSTNAFSEARSSDCPDGSRPVRRRVRSRKRPRARRGNIAGSSALWAGRQTVGQVPGRLGCAGEACATPYETAQSAERIRAQQTEMIPPLRIENLHRRHAADSSDCEREALNRFLIRYAIRTSRPELRTPLPVKMSRITRWSWAGWHTSMRRNG